MPNVVVAVKSSGLSGGAAGITRYISESKVNPEKEILRDDQARPLFSTNSDNLNHLEANEILAQATDALPTKEELIHLVISPEEGQFEELGSTPEERLEAFHEIVREAANEIQKEVDFKELIWIAGVHLNTDIPHVHIAINRAGWDQSKERLGHIHHLPRTLLPHYEKDPQGERIFLPGKIAHAISEGIDRRRQQLHDKNLQPQPQTHEETLTPTKTQNEPDRSIVDEVSHEIPSESHQQNTIATDHQNQNPNAAPTTNQQPDREPPADHSATISQPENPAKHQWRDRYILGRAMVARGEVDRLETDLKSTREHGDKRRFRVFDASHGRTRQISEFDIRRRADATAVTTVRQNDTVNPEQRQEARQSSYDSEIERHEKGIKDHQIIVAKTIAKLERELTAAQDQLAELKPHTTAIRQHYQANQTPLPVPLLRAEEVTKLQDQAIAARNPARVKNLENIRESLAAERGERPRSDQDIARLDGHLLVARSEQAVRHERLLQFERTRHQTRWEIGDRKYSLSDLDRQISQQQNRSRLFGTPLNITTLHLRPSSRREAALQVKELTAIREIVVTNIQDRRLQLAAAVAEAGKMTSVLSAIHVKEHDRLLSQGGERQDKILTRSEINQLVEHGNTLSDRAMLTQALILETDFEQQQSDDKKPTLSQQAARAIGREILSEIALQQASSRLDSFKEHKQFTPVAIKDLQGNEQTARLFDFRHPRHPILWLAHRISESKHQRHLRRETTKAIDAEDTRLHEDLDKATKCHQLNKSVSDTNREHLIASGQAIPEATFTPKQIIQLEIYATRHQDPIERSRIVTLITNAEAATHSQAKQSHSDRERALSPTNQLHYDDHQDHNHDDQGHDGPRNHPSYQPERERPSEPLIQPTHQEASHSPQQSPTDLPKESPDLDQLH